MDEGDADEEDEDYLAEHGGGEQVDEEEDAQWLEQAGERWNAALGLAAGLGWPGEQARRTNGGWQVGAVCWVRLQRCRCHVL